MTTTPEKKKEPTKAVQIISGILTFAIIGAVIWIIVSVSIGMNAPSATFSSKITSISAIDPSDVGVAITVKNTSNIASQATCAVVVSSSGGGYTGDNGATTVNKLKAHSTSTVILDVGVTTGGAKYIDPNSSTVTCTQ